MIQMFYLSWAMLILLFLYYYNSYINNIINLIPSHLKTQQ